MLFSSTKNWKKFLGVDDEITLNEMLMKGAKHRGAYKNAEDVKIAQVWCAMIEMKKEMEAVDRRLKRIEYLLGGILKRNEEDKQDILKSLRNF